MSRAIVRAPRATLARPLPSPAPPRVIVVEVRRAPCESKGAHASARASDSVTLSLLDALLRGLIMFLGAVLYLCMEHGKPMRKNDH